MAVEYGGNYMATMSSICNWNNSLALGKKSDLTLYPGENLFMKS